MTSEFVRTQPVNDLKSYPVWAQEMIASVQDQKRKVVEHEIFRRMRDATLSHEVTKNFLIGGWPVIEQFPQYMALNILKIRYGRSRGEDMARRYLLHNIRVEQNHADQWVNWAVACDISKEALLTHQVRLEAYGLSQWCWYVCEREDLAASMAATNYAIEGVTGEWCSFVCSSETYENTFPKSERRRAMNWLKLHAHYDDLHPWEALDIICTLVGSNPTLGVVNRLSACIGKSYDYMRISMDAACMVDR